MPEYAGLTPWTPTSLPLGSRMLAPKGALSVHIRAGEGPELPVDTGPGKPPLRRGTLPALSAVGEQPADQYSDDDKLELDDLLRFLWQTASALLLCWTVHCCAMHLVGIQPLCMSTMDRPNRITPFLK